MKTKRSLLIIIIIVTVSFTKDNPVEKADVSNKADLIHIAAGSGLLAFELVGIPLINIYAVNPHMPALRNPFHYVYEKEPYIEDKLWHFVGASMFTELNYYIYSRLFMMENPYLMSALTSLTFWTGMECMDALVGSGFSLLDQSANMLGITFAILRLYYPNMPLRVRVGVKDWSAFASGFSRVLSGTIHHESGAQYDYMKVDIVYMFPSENLYAGVAVSRKDDKKNQFGVTAGFDIANWLIGKKKGWWNGPLRFFDNYFSVNLEFTIWGK